MNSCLPSLILMYSFGVFNTVHAQESSTEMEASDISPFPSDVGQSDPSPTWVPLRVPGSIGGEEAFRISSEGAFKAGSYSVISSATVTRRYPSWSRTDPLTVEELRRSMRIWDGEVRTYISAVTETICGQSLPFTSGTIYFQLPDDLATHQGSASSAPTAIDLTS